jgi:hypothetical protein
MESQRMENSPLEEIEEWQEGLHQHEKLMQRILLTMSGKQYHHHVFVMYNQTVVLLLLAHSKWLHMVLMCAFYHQ